LCFSRECTRVMSKPREPQNITHFERKKDKR
jgi:hypothetical protein